MRATVMIIAAAVVALAPVAGAEEIDRPQPPALIATEAPLATGAPTADAAPSASAPRRAPELADAPNAGPTVAEPAPQAVAAQPAAAASGCAGKIGVSRVHVLDTTGGPHFGRVNRYEGKPFLGPKEVLFTFDDGPNPRATGRVLDALKDHCVKATFFVVGSMTRAHADLARRIAAEGHTIAGHTVTHPMPFGKTPYVKAVQEIEMGYQILVDRGITPAPLFRFPGLSDTPALLAYLSARHISALSVDVVSGDTNNGATIDSVIRNTMRSVERNNGGIILLHDPLKRSAAALPEILRQLKDGGYKIVHLTTAHTYTPVGADRLRAVADQVAEIETATTAQSAAQDGSADAPLGDAIATESIPGAASGLPRGLLRLIPLVAPEPPAASERGDASGAPTAAAGAAGIDGISPIY